MYMNVIDLSKSVSFVLEDIDIGGQIQYLTCTGPLGQNDAIAFFINFCPVSKINGLISGI